MDITIIHTKFRPDRPGVLRRARAEVDGHLVTYRSERDRGWRCNACELWTHARCRHTAAAWRHLRRSRAVGDEGSAPVGDAAQTPPDAA